VVPSDPPAPDPPPFEPVGALLEHAASKRATVQVIGWIRMGFSTENRGCSFGRLFV